jgi:predicted metal-dependent hydrolase
MLSESNPTSARAEIPVRDPDLQFDQPIPQFWFRDNRFLTFLFNGFNLTFPQGERYFVRAVHDHSARIDDPQLREQIRGFSGQEGEHARAHERLFGALRAQGYDLEPFFRVYTPFIKKVSKSPAPFRLAATAALEHYTASLASVVFTPGFMDGVHEPLRKLLVWHAAEELEHRAVAFDVLQATHPSYVLRCFAFGVSTLSLIFWITLGMRLFIQQSRTPGRLVWRDFRRVDQLYPLSRLLRELGSYLRPGFHPHQGSSLDRARQQLHAEGLA